MDSQDDKASTVMTVLAFTHLKISCFFVSIKIQACNIDEASEKHLMG